MLANVINLIILGSCVLCFSRNIMRLQLVFLSVFGLFLTQNLYADEFKLVFQSSDPAGSPNFMLQKSWADNLKKKSKNRIQVNLLPVGSAIAYNKTLDAVGVGVLDGHITDTSYFASQDPAFGLIANPVGAYSSPEELLDFMYRGKGEALMRELFAPYGVYFIGATTPGLEALVSKVPLKGIADLKGLKIRTPEGLVKDVFAAAGAIPIVLPSSEVFVSLDKHIIDAADYTIFATNHAQGLHSIAKYPVFPGFHSLPLVDISMNMQKWQSMPKKLQAIMYQSVKDYAYLLYKMTARKNQAALLLAQKDAEIHVQTWSDNERKKFRDIAKTQWAKVAKRSANAQKVYVALTDYLEKKDKAKKP